MPGYVSCVSCVCVCVCGGEGMPGLAGLGGRRHVHLSVSVECGMYV